MRRPPSSPPVRRGRLRPVAALAAILALLTTGSASAGPLPPAPVETLPVLWEGRIVDASGAPVRARVDAFIRPPASIIPARREVDASGAGAPASIPLASQDTGRDGRFLLRAGRPAVPPAYAPDGWLHVMLWAETPDGAWAVATDSVRFVAPGGALPRGAWLSSWPAAERAERLRSTLENPAALRRALDAVRTGDLARGDERPAVIEVAGRSQPAATGGSPRAKLGGGWTSPGDPYRGCTARYVEERDTGMRTIADIDVGPHWSYRIDYDQTRTTSWDVGYERSGGDWKVAGSGSFSDSSQSGFHAEYGPYANRYRKSYQVELVHARVLWQCASRTSPGPFHVRTVEPESWTHGTFNQGEPVVGCKRSTIKPVAGRTYQWRKDGSTSRYSASAAVLGFSGKAAVTYTSAIRLGWKNHLDDPRYVCGESGDPYKDHTRVTALD